MSTLEGIGVPGEVAAASPDVSTIFAAHRGFVWRMLSHLGVSDADREDVLQEVFVVVHRKIGGYREQDKLRAWLYAILVRVVRDHRRKVRRRRETVTDAPPERVEPPGQERGLQERQALEQAHRWLAVLPEQQRLVFVLYEVEQMSMNEIALALACPVQTAYSRLHRARELVVAQARRAEVQGASR